MVRSASSDSSETFLIRLLSSDFTYTLTNNTELRKIDSRFRHAEISYPTISIDPAISGGVEAAKEKQVVLNAMEMRPPLMDLSGKTKYPVLFQV